jgi:hypothetical protein
VRAAQVQERTVLHVRCTHVADVTGNVWNWKANI